VLLAMRRADKAFWWDVMTETTAVRSSAVESATASHRLSGSPELRDQNAPAD